MRIKHSSVSHNIIVYMCVGCGYYFDGFVAAKRKGEYNNNESNPKIIISLCRRN